MIHPIIIKLAWTRIFLVALIVNNPSSMDSWVGEIPWRREWQPSPVFLPGQSHGQRSLADNSPWGCKESYSAEQLSTVWTKPFSSNDAKFLREIYFINLPKPLP